MTAPDERERRRLTRAALKTLRVPVSAWALPGGSYWPVVASDDETRRIAQVISSGFRPAPATVACVSVSAPAEELPSPAAAAFVPKPARRVARFAAAHSGASSASCLSAGSAPAPTYERPQSSSSQPPPALLHLSQGPTCPHLTMWRRLKSPAYLTRVKCGKVNTRRTLTAAPLG